MCHQNMLISTGCCLEAKVPTVVTIVGQDAAGNHDRVSISPISPKGEVPKPWEGLFPLFWWPMSIHPVKTWATKIGEIGTLSVFSLGGAKTMRGSLFPLFPLRVKCQNHERVPISRISSILVANVYSSCQDMDHQNRGNRDPFNVFPWWSAKSRGPLFPLRVKCRNHERVPISPISPIFRAYLFILSRHGPPK